MKTGTNPDLPQTSTAWVIVAVRVPATPSRHRVAVWRELRRVGAVPLGQGVWVLPDAPGPVEVIDRVREMAARGGGDVIVVEGRGRAADDAAELDTLFATAREDEWSEFITDCAKFEDKIARDIATGKFTLAELEEEEQSLDRLRRWHRDLKKRDLFGVPAGTVALARLRACNDRLESYADLVYAHVQHA